MLKRLFALIDSGLYINFAVQVLLSDKINFLSLPNCLFFNQLFVKK
ncbi:hypothetical protein FDUTEX481_06023 [Tolypothrix sp. PCC 7601]|nr:hypothetical protein FDUTEX481_06023 [Tolypothrix sp. PCC 7601]